ncbi:unnamed protein product [Boreogadus saida]
MQEQPLHSMVFQQMNGGTGEGWWGQSRVQDQEQVWTSLLLVDQEQVWTSLLLVFPHRDMGGAPAGRVISPSPPSPPSRGPGVGRGGAPESRGGLMFTSVPPCADRRDGEQSTIASLWRCC